MKRGSDVLKDLFSWETGQGVTADATANDFRQVGPASGLRDILVWTADLTANCRDYEPRSWENQEEENCCVQFTWKRPFIDARANKQAIKKAQSSNLEGTPFRANAPIPMKASSHQVV